MPPKAPKKKAAAGPPPLLADYAPSDRAALVCLWRGWVLGPGAGEPPWKPPPGFKPPGKGGGKGANTKGDGKGGHSWCQGGDVLKEPEAKKGGAPRSAEEPEEAAARLPAELLPRALGFLPRAPSASRPGAELPEVLEPPSSFLEEGASYSFLDKVRVAAQPAAQPATQPAGQPASCAASRFGSGRTRAARSSAPTRKSRPLSQLPSQLHRQLHSPLHSPLHSQLRSQLHRSGIIWFSRRSTASRQDMRSHSPLPSQLRSELHSSQLHSRPHSQLCSQVFWAARVGKARDEKKPGLRTARALCRLEGHMKFLVTGSISPPGADLPPDFAPFADEEFSRTNALFLAKMLIKTNSSPKVVELMNSSTFDDSFFRILAKLLRILQN